MNKFLKASILCPMLVLGMSQASAAVFSSEQVIANQQFNFNKQQVLSYVDSAEVQNKLIELGVSPADAKQRIANMTAEELSALNSQMNEMPAGGIVGVVITVLVVVVVTDLMGLTDVYPFINPI
ncbi:PA2779 family protein [Rheinheimera sp. 1928-s]|uniref:PA2779 family protein n=1 Tax=Rheinheimera sp. 1928-s TaxID=3033803 RepID=UPI0026061951|nr:PA2779 family protein [Rheinheimera sp. 1928-s]MDF3124657.1 PA2779 family protein [Rheinheimera sp. 1928-s]